MLKAIANFKIYQHLLKYWFTLLHFVIDDPVCKFSKVCLKLVLSIKMADKVNLFCF